MTQAEFCRERDVNLATFGMWRSKFIASGECESHAVKTCAVESESKGFIPLKVITDENLSLTAGDKGVADSEMIELSFPHGIILRIPCDARYSRLKSTLPTLLWICGSLSMACLPLYWIVLIETPLIKVLTMFSVTAHVIV